jgi:nucleotide-binding universal stress UspA family protein
MSDALPLDDDNVPPNDDNLVAQNGERARGHHIVVGIDGSSGSRAALQWAIGEAKIRQVPLHAVMCAPADPGAHLGDHSSSPSGPDLAGLRALLDQATAAAGAVTVTVTGSVIHGNPGEVLVAAAMGADLLVVGSRPWASSRDAHRVY